MIFGGGFFASSSVLQGAAKAKNFDPFSL